MKNKAYCDGFDTKEINNDAVLLIKHYWVEDDYCAEGFIKYSDGLMVKFGDITMASPNEDLTTTFFNITPNYVGICSCEFNEFYVMSLFDVNSRMDISNDNLEMKNAQQQFRKELMELALNELSDEDRNSIIEYFKKYYDESESVINNFIRAINMQMCYVLQSEFNDAMERSSLFRKLIVAVMANKELSETELNEFLNQYSLKYNK